MLYFVGKKTNMSRKHHADRDTTFFESGDTFCTEKHLLEEALECLNMSLWNKTLYI